MHSYKNMASTTRSGSMEQWARTSKNVFLVVLVIVVIALAVKIGLDASNTSEGSEELLFRPMKPLGGNDDNNNNTKICLSEPCVSAAARILKKMEFKVDPCEDFHEFSCGRFLKETALPDDKAVLNPFVDLAEVIYERGRLLLEAEDDPSDWPIFSKTKLLYKSCMDEERLEMQGVQPLKTLLSDLGGWPAVEGDVWAGGNNWYDTIHDMGRMGFNTDFLFSVRVSTDFKNSSSRAIYLDQPALGMAREFLVKGVNDSAVQHYLTFMQETAVLLGAADSDTVDSELKEALLFEIELASAFAPREDRRNATKQYNPYPVGSYQSLPGHPPSWVEYVGQIVGLELDPINDKIIIADPDYMRRVSDILSRVNPRVISNYLCWRATKSVVEYLDKAARSVAQEYKRAIFGLNSAPPRWKVCAEAVGFNSHPSADSNFRIPAASMYLRKYFSRTAKLQMVQMIDFLKSSFLQMLKDLDWMDAKTRERAEKKLVTMTEFIAYPDEILDRAVVEKHHEGIVIDENDFMGNMLRLNQWSRRFQFGRLYEKVDKKYWVDHSLVVVVNAFYSSSNAINFPAGILDGVFFHPLVPKYLNFGAIGAVIGHEITHGFDDSGRQFDFEGNLRNWWEDETRKKFIDKTRCIIDQYGNYSQLGMKLNGNASQGENIADNGGINAAYAAYEMWEKQHQTEPTLPGLDFTPRQLLWVSWSQQWCFIYSDAALKNQILTRPHSPARFRAIGPLSNSLAFAKDFNCPENSNMNPKKKCSVW